MKTAVILLIIFVPFYTAWAGPLKSATLLEFADDGHLIVVDAYEGVAYEFNVPQQKGADTFFNLYDLEAKVANHLKVRLGSVIVRGIAIDDQGNVYVGADIVHPQKDNEGVVLSISESGTIETVPLEKHEVKRLKIAEIPESYKANLINGGNQQPYFTDLAFGEDEFFLGVHGQTASSPQIVSTTYPLGGKVQNLTIDADKGTYVKTFLWDKIKGEKGLLSILSDGSMVSLVVTDGAIKSQNYIRTKGGETNIIKLKKDYFLISENYCMATISKKDLSKLSSADSNDDFFSLFSFYPQNGLLDIGDHDKKKVLVLKRHYDTGALDLLSIRKLTKLRLSEFESEYDFPDYEYKGFLNKIIKTAHKKFRADENLSKPTFK